MATYQELRKVSSARLKTVETLIGVNDWDMAGYLMGYVLECALKAAICRNLKLKEYPDNIKHDKMRNFFITHDFETLLIVSGMFDIFKLKKRPKRVLDNWSHFTIYYQSNWTDTRYKPGCWKDTDVKLLYTNLTETPYGILNQIKGHKYGR